MLEEEAVVLSVHGKIAEVLTEKKSACGSCAAKNGCGTSLVESLFPQRSRTFQALNEAQARAGDKVIIGLDESLLQMASLMIYLVPILGLIGGAMAGNWLAGDNEAISVLGGVTGFLVSLAGVRYFSSRLGGKQGYQARIIRVLPTVAPGITGIQLQEISKG